MGKLNICISAHKTVTKIEKKNYSSIKKCFGNFWQVFRRLFQLFQMILLTLKFSQERAELMLAYIPESREKRMKKLLLCKVYFSATWIIQCYIFPFSYQYEVLFSTSKQENTRHPTPHPTETWARIDSIYNVYLLM